MKLSIADIKAYFNEDESPFIEIFDTIDSTSNEAKRAIEHGLASEAIFVSHHQTAGRGRHGKSFYSPDESGLYFSIVLHPEISLEKSVMLTVAAAVATREVIEAQTKKHPMIKWVNDIFIDNKKVCGILAEAINDYEKGIIKSAVIGIGINITTKDFPDELDGIASSLGEEINRNETVALIFKRLKEICDKLENNKGFIDEYRKYSLAIGKTVSFKRNGVDHKAKAVDVSDNGELLVITEGGEEILLNSGEISIKL